jgi:rod shape-determining protein MreC
MYNLLNLLKRYYFVFLFLAMEIFCFYLIIQNSRFHGSLFFNTTYELTGNVHASLNTFRAYLNLKTVNDSLLAENAKLRSKMNEAFYDRMHKVLSFEESSLMQQYKYIPAKVVNTSVNRRNNFITIDKGSIHDIESLYGVMSDEGVVGIVKDVSNHFSSVISVLHGDFRVSAKVVETGYVGSVYWDGREPGILTITDLPLHIEISPGQNVVTSAYSKLFPENVPIGIITEVKSGSSDNFKTARLQSFVDFHKLANVYVIKNLLKDEQSELEVQSGVW